MKKRLAMSVITALAMSVGVAVAADLGNLSGQSCGEFEGTWHFVNNQSGTTTPGSLYVLFSTGAQGPIAPSKVTPNGTQHFYVQSDGTLLGASTDLNGKLVLSDFTCNGKKEPPK